MDTPVTSRKFAYIINRFPKMNRWSQECAISLSVTHTHTTNGIWLQSSVSLLTWQQNHHHHHTTQSPWFAGLLSSKIHVIISNYVVAFSSLTEMYVWVSACMCMCVWNSRACDERRFWRRGRCLRNCVYTVCFRCTWQRTKILLDHKCVYVPIGT